MESQSLDLSLFTSKAAAAALVPAGADLAARLEDTLRCLDEERAKIEAFKRELPNSILIVAEVMKILQYQLEECRAERDKCVPDKDKMNWMSSAQLWSDNYEDSDSKVNTEEEEEKEMCLESETWSGGAGGAFTPFKKVAEEKVSVELPNLCLVSDGIKSTSPPAPVVDGGSHYGGLDSKIRTAVSTPVTGHLSLHCQNQQQMSRKARRCWSPELHRRFVLSLQQLGGPQVATPKQIRELMKVDGLTNDEVKSHLQKYRLHSRRVPNSSQVHRPPVGGSWINHYSASSQKSASQSGSPQGPLQFAGSGVAVSVTAGDSCDDEDGRSESYSWK